MVSGTNGDIDNARGFSFRGSHPGSMVERLHHEKRNSGSYQGVRHLIPGNLSQLREWVKNCGGGRRFEALRQRLQAGPVRPPLVHRPGADYSNSIEMALAAPIIKGNEKKH